MASQQNLLTKDKAEDILRGFSTRPYGILGQQLTAKKKLIDVAPIPSAVSGLVFVDPAGLHHIQGFFKDEVWVEGSPRNAHGAAGAIYQAIGISNDALFPKEVRDGIKKTGDAKFHQYIKKSDQEDNTITKSLVIHCVGPDFRKPHPITKTDYVREQAIEALTNAYTNILSEFLKSGMPALRLLPVSGGIFSGSFLSQLPKITWEALLRALMHLSLVQILELKRRDIEFCLFMEKELVDFCEVGFNFKSKEAVEFVKGIPLKPYGVLGQQLLSNKDMIDVAAFPAAIPGLVFVDPAGLHHIKPPGGPKTAHGAAGAIYKAIGILEHERFPDDVIDTIHHGGDAAFHRYLNVQGDAEAEFLVIHSIGPDFRKNFESTESLYSRSQAVEALGRSYGNILSEFVRSGQPALRLLPLSGGIHAGSFLPQVPALTWEALQIGYWYLGPGEREAVCARNIDLCVFAENEFKSFERVGFNPYAHNQAHLVYQGYAEKAEAASKSALSAGSLGAPAEQFFDESPRPAASSTEQRNPPLRRSTSIEGEDYAEYYFGPISKHMSIFASAVSTVTGVLGLQRKKNHRHGADPVTISDTTDWDVHNEDEEWTHAGPVTESMFAFGGTSQASNSGASPTAGKK